MRTAEGVACPMHRTPGAHNQKLSGPGSAVECAMRSTCAGPIATLASLFFVHGILPAPLSVPARLDTPERVAPAADAFLNFVIRPDSPPPRHSAIA
jgi:hypothetical protein